MVFQLKDSFFNHLVFGGNFVHELTYQYAGDEL